MEDLEESVNEFGGKVFLSEFKALLIANGWTEETEFAGKSDLFSEDWGWCVFLRYQGQQVLLGLHAHTGGLSDYDDYLKMDWVDAGLTVECCHRRTFLEIFRGKNKFDPEVFAKTYQSIWEMLSGLNCIRKLSSTEQTF